MKELDAKTKWCPMVRCAGFKAAANRDGQTGWTYPKYLCIGSDCMMWVEIEDRTFPDHGDCGLKSKTKYVSSSLRESIDAQSGRV